MGSPELRLVESRTIEQSPLNVADVFYETMAKFNLRRWGDRPPIVLRNAVQKILGASGQDVEKQKALGAVLFIARMFQDRAFDPYPFAELKLTIQDIFSSRSSENQVIEALAKMPKTSTLNNICDTKRIKEIPGSLACLEMMKLAGLFTCAHDLGEMEVSPAFRAILRSDSSAIQEGLKDTSLPNRSALFLLSIAAPIDAPEGIHTLLIARGSKEAPTDDAELLRCIKEFDDKGVAGKFVAMLENSGALDLKYRGLSGDYSHQLHYSNLNRIMERAALLNPGQKPDLLDISIASILSNQSTRLVISGSSGIETKPWLVSALRAAARNRRGEIETSDLFNQRKVITAFDRFTTLLTGKRVSFALVQDSHTNHGSSRLEVENRLAIHLTSAALDSIRSVFLEDGRYRRERIEASTIPVHQLLLCRLLLEQPRNKPSVAYVALKEAIKDRLTAK